MKMYDKKRNKNMNMHSDHFLGSRMTLSQYFLGETIEMLNSCMALMPQTGDGRKHGWVFYTL